MITEELNLKTADGITLAASLFRPQTAVRGALLIAGGVGIPRQFYKYLAAYFAESGFVVMTLDYRGVGGSRLATEEGRHMRMADWGARDIDAALTWLYMEIRAPQLYFLGHSAGGQLVGLAPASRRLKGLVLVASQLGYYGHWRGVYKAGMWALWHLLIPLLALGRDRFPARMLGVSSTDVPAGVMRQWASFGRTPGYLFNPAHGLDTSRYQNLARPLLAYYIEDDVYAPAPATDALLAQYRSAQIERRVLKPDASPDGKIGHLGFFRQKMRTSIWPELLTWLEQQA